MFLGEAVEVLRHERGEKQVGLQQHEPDEKSAVGAVTAHERDRPQDQRN